MIMSVIWDHIHAGSILNTDYWKGYPKAIDGLNTYQNANYKHQKVNHKKNFVSPEGFHTNTMEGTWSGVKKSIHPRQMRLGIIDDKLIIFVWRRQNAGNLWAAFLTAICTNYRD
jgi:hypothetical protein